MCCTLVPAHPAASYPPPVPHGPDCPVRSARVWTLRLPPGSPRGDTVAFGLPSSLPNWDGTCPLDSNQASVTLDGVRKSGTLARAHPQAAQAAGHARHTATACMVGSPARHHDAGRWSRPGRRTDLRTPPRASLQGWVRPKNRGRVREGGRRIRRARRQRQSRCCAGWGGSVLSRSFGSALRGSRATGSLKKRIIGERRGA